MTHAFYEGLLDHCKTLKLSFCVTSSDLKRVLFDIETYKDV